MQDSLLTCAEFRQVLKDYLNQKLDAAHAAQTEIHALRCEQCRIIFSTARMTHTEITKQES